MPLDPVTLLEFDRLDTPTRCEGWDRVAAADIGPDALDRESEDEGLVVSGALILGRNETSGVRTTRRLTAGARLSFPPSFSLE